MSQHPFTSAEHAALPEILTSEQAATILHVSPAQVRKLAAAGKVPATQLGRTWRFSKSRLEQFIRTEERPLEDD